MHRDHRKSERGSLRQPVHRPTAAVVIIKLTSPAFRAGEIIPSKYSCEGADVQPIRFFLKNNEPRNVFTASR